MTHSLSAAAANLHDLTETENLLHGEEAFISADFAYRGAQKREELKDIKADWLRLLLPIKRKAPSKSSQETPENKQDSDPNTLKPAF